MTQERGGKFRTGGVSTKHRYLSPKVRRVAERIATLPSVKVVHPAKIVLTSRGRAVRLQGERSGSLKILAVSSGGSQELRVVPRSSTTIQQLREELERLTDELRSLL